MINTAIVLALVSYGLFYHHQAQAQQTSDITITNASYDATREFYTAYNSAFATYWRQHTGQTVTTTVTNGGSGSQANAVASGSPADVVSLALAQDVTTVQHAGLINAGWQHEFPQNAAPYTSTIVFLVRKGNPSQIQDWDDLVKQQAAVITPNPKTSGAARWNYLAAWAYADAHNHHDRRQTLAFMKRLYQHVTVLDAGSRNATNSFTRNHQGNVLITWENEALATMKKYPGQYQLITPSLSIKCEPSVAIVDKNATQDGTTKVAQAYVNYLYSKTGQTLAAKSGFRPTDPRIRRRFAKQFPKTNCVTIDQAFGGWAHAQKTHFDPGGTFDQIYTTQ